MERSTGANPGRPATWSPSRDELAEPFWRNEPKAAAHKNLDFRPVGPVVQSDAE
jgi:hypothetical protein